MFRLFLKRLLYEKNIAMLMALVLSFSGASNVWAANASMGFVDVNPDVYYYDSIAYVNEAGLMTGRDDTHFHPDDYLQRQELGKKTPYYEWLQ